MKISIFTSMTDPEKRMDPWREALKCYEDFADEVVVVGQNWPEEFKFSYIGEVFQNGFDKSSGDWVVHMDIDNFFHENDLKTLRLILKKHNDLPTIAFPKYQIFTPNRFHVKANMCIALNKKKFPSIKMNGGGDLCQPTLDNKLLNPNELPLVKIPIWNYDSMFKTKEIIARDRARFARAWYSEFGNWGDRGGETEELAFNAWLNMVENRFKNHVLKLKIEDHPKYIKEKLNNLDQTQFGYNLFGIKDRTKPGIKNYIKNYKNKFIS